MERCSWAASQPHPPTVEPEWGPAYLARSGYEDAAARLFAALHNDGSVQPPWPWEFAFDPCFPETGWAAWRAAEAMVRAMAAAVITGDQIALGQLGKAFEHLGLRSEVHLPQK